jgi:hypothetical protein
LVVESLNSIEVNIEADSKAAIEQLNAATRKILELSDAAPRPDTLMIREDILQSFRQLLSDLDDIDRARRWPRWSDAREQVVAVLGRVVAGDFTRVELVDFAGAHGIRCTETIVARTIRRAKSERLIAWSPEAQRYVALPPWQHRRRHDRQGWTWPISRSW